jgi:penicillin-binding protein 1A
LSQPEAVQLAGIIPAPSRYDPGEHPQLAAERYDYVVSRLVELGWVESEGVAALRGARPQVVPPVTATRFPAVPFFLQLVERELGARLGEDRIYTGLEVTTTLDLKVQERAVAAYAQGFSGIGPSGALVALDPGTGGVRALVGGKDYAADQLNLALAPRQPGSTFKPFALAAWVEEGFSPESVFPAPAERVFEVGGAPWPVRNYGGRGYAPMTLRQATWRSVNTVYGDLVVRLGPQRLADVATRAGIGRSSTPIPRSCSARRRSAPSSSPRRTTRWPPVACIEERSP